MNGKQFYRESELAGVVYLPPDDWLEQDFQQADALERVLAIVAKNIHLLEQNQQIKFPLPDGIQRSPMAPPYN